MAISAVDRASIIGDIRRAAASTGVDFGYLLAEARIESDLDPAAAAPSSSARGLYQFTAGTWLDTVRKHGAAHGLAWAADALRAGADASTRAAILDLRQNAAAASSMAAAFAADNATALQSRLGHAANAAELYLAHFLGAGGAVRFLAARQANPEGLANTAVPPAAVKANAGIFTTRSGRIRTVGEVYDRFAAKLGLSAAVASGQRPAVLAGNASPAGGKPLPVATPQAARAAYLLLAELGA